MSVQSKTALNSTIDTDIVGGGNITAAELNAILGNMVDSYEDIIQTYTYANMLAIATPVTGQKVLVSDFPNTGNLTLFLYNGTYWKPWCGSVILDVNTTQVGTDADTVEKILATYDLPANFLLRTGDYVEVEFFGFVAANAQGKIVRFYFGSGVTQFGGTSTSNNYQFRGKVVIVRTGATTQSLYAELYAASASGNWGGQTTRGYVDFGLSGVETLSSAVTIKVTGENAVATADDVVFTGWKITLHRK